MPWTSLRAYMHACLCLYASSSDIPRLPPPPPWPPRCPHPHPLPRPKCPPARPPDRCPTAAQPTGPYRYPSSVKLLRSYGRFLEEVKNDPWTAAKYYA